MALNKGWFPPEEGQFRLSSGIWVESASFTKNAASLLAEGTDDIANSLLVLTAFVSSNTSHFCSCFIGQSQSHGPARPQWDREEYSQGSQGAAYVSILRPLFQEVLP